MTMIQKAISKRTSLLLIAITLSIMTSCKKKSQEQPQEQKQEQSSNEKENIIVGANQTEAYLNLLKGKNIALVANNTSVIFKNDDNKSNQHLLDSLLALGINVNKIFTPEHGLRGVVDAGEVINNEVDEKTGIPIISLYATNNNNSSEKFKPSAEQLKNVDVLLFDIQDVGVRFYTYLSTLHYIMEACAEHGIPVLVLDRPNPNAHYIDGPILEKEYKSFIGLHPVPIVYGMTIGEYAKMINGEKWLRNGIQSDLTVVPLKNYNHDATYSLPLRPSPNLPNDKSINLYASLCLFEGTNVSCGRGTEMQFQIFGAPDLPSDPYNYNFTPEPNFGAKTPKHLNQLCHGLDLSKTKNLNSLNFNWLVDAYKATPDKAQFFREDSFNRLAGTNKLKEQIEQGLSFDEIKATWQDSLSAFKETRAKYLIYN